VRVAIERVGAFENVNYCIAQMARETAVIKLKRKKKTPARGRRFCVLDPEDRGSASVPVLTGVSASCTHLA
jgi:hypothetical protein